LPSRFTGHAPLSGGKSIIIFEIWDLKFEIWDLRFEI